MSIINIIMVVENSYNLGGDNEGHANVGMAPDIIRIRSSTWEWLQCNKK